MRPLPDRQGGLVCAPFNLVAPLASKATDTRTMDSASDLTRWAGSCAISPLKIRRGDADSANNSTSPTATTPGTRTSTTATRTTTTRTIKTGLVLSADYSASSHADFSFKDLVLAYFDCREHKRNTASALAFETRLEDNLSELYDELISGAYRPGPSTCFPITRPKMREVWAAQFRDRIPHHLLYNRISPRFYASFIADSCACIPGRGTLYGAQRLEVKVRSITQNWARPAYYMKLDLANFFVSIDKNILWGLLEHKIPESWWRSLCHTILFHDPRKDVIVQDSGNRLAQIPPHKSLFNHPSHKGLPIGNLSSQFFANVLLNVLDQFVKHRIRSKHYIRYVDDFILLHESAQWLNDARQQIEVLLAEKLDLRLNPAKTILQPVDRGIDFVGHVIKPWRRSLRRRTFNDAMRRMKTMPASDVYESANSYLGLLRQASHSHGDRRKLAKIILKRGHAVNFAMTKAYRKSSTTGATRC